MEKGAQTILDHCFDYQLSGLVVIGTFFSHFGSQVLIGLHVDLKQDDYDPKGLGMQPQGLALVLWSGRSLGA